MNDLSSQSWFCDETVRAVMVALAKNGQAARFVGGCVRDSLCGRPVHDIDIATPEKPQAVQDLLERQGIKVIPTGIEHGTLTAVLNNKTFEITTLRSDVSSDGRRATVAFTDDWLEDAKRRDFTFNAMSLDSDGTLYDPFQGGEDLANGIVRFVGSARERIREDYLRLLRFFRFNAYYGKGMVQAETLAACAQEAQGLDQLSGERVASEMLRLLGAPHPAKWISVMQRHQILAHLIPQTQDPHALEMLCAFEETPDALRRLAVLLPEGRDAVDDVVKRWRLSNEQKQRLMKARAPEEALLPTVSVTALRCYLYRFGAEAARDQLFIYWAEKQFSGIGPTEQALLSEIDSWQKSPCTLPLSGRDLMERGYTTGPQLGHALKTVEDWWCRQGCQADKAACLTYLASLD